MALYGNRLLSDSQIPVVNGRRITSIYGKMETAYSNSQLTSDAYGKKPDYWLLETKDKEYVYKYDEKGEIIRGSGKFVEKPNIKVKELPKELADLFGKQLLRGKVYNISRMYIRTNCSGNGSFTDQTLDFSGECGGGTISYYQMKRWTNGEYKSCIFSGEAEAEKIEKILGKKYEVEELPFWFDVEYPCSYIRTEGGLNYPDTKCSGWRRFHEMPYVRSIGRPENVRVFSEEMNAHLFFEKVNEVKKGDTDLSVIQFRYGYGSNPDQFCDVGRWKKEYNGGGVIKFKVLTKRQGNYGGISFELGGIGDDGKVQFKRDYRVSDMYRLVCIRYVK